VAFLAGADFFAGVAFLAGAAFFVCAAFAGVVRAAAVLARAVGADADLRIGVLLDFRVPGLRAAAFVGAAFVAAAFDDAAALAVVALLGADLVAAFLGVALAVAALLGAAAFAGAGAATPVSPARSASSFATVAEALATWRCRRTSSARASRRSRSAFAIARSRTCCFAIVPPVLSTAGSMVEPGSDRRDDAPRRLTPRSPPANGAFIGASEPAV
jgi:hypothetical protein